MSSAIVTTILIVIASIFTVIWTKLDLITIQIVTPLSASKWIIGQQYNSTIISWTTPPTIELSNSSISKSKSASSTLKFAHFSHSQTLNSKGVKTKYRNRIRLILRSASLLLKLLIESEQVTRWECCRCCGYRVISPKKLSALHY